MTSLLLLVVVVVLWLRVGLAIGRKSRRLFGGLHWTMQLSWASTVVDIRMQHSLYSPSSSCKLSAVAWSKTRRAECYHQSKTPLSTRRWLPRLCVPFQNTPATLSHHRMTDWNSVLFTVWPNDTACEAAESAILYTSVPSVHLSVRLKYSGIVSKRLNLS